jgi:uncharacterized membrane protein YdbT with pleckstrin-like domain
MGYVEQNLMPGEQVIYKAKLHWAMFIDPLVRILLGLAILVVFVTLYSGEATASYGAIFGGLLLFAGVLQLLAAVTRFFTTEFGLTDRRIIAKAGAIRRVSLELLLQKVESVTVDQPLLGRMLNYGTITVTGTGGTKQRFPHIADPMELRRRVNTQISGA